MTYVVADMAGRISSPLYGMFAARSARNGYRHAGRRQTARTQFVSQPADTLRDHGVGIDWLQVPTVWFRLWARRALQWGSSSFTYWWWRSSGPISAAHHHGADPATVVGVMPEPCMRCWARGLFCHEHDPA